MALRINLYHEVLRAKRQKQYDPLKLSMFGLGVILVGMAGYYGVQLKHTSDVRSVFAAHRAEFEQLDPQAKKAEAKEAELNKQIALAEKFTNRMEKRINWAPLFESIMTRQECYPDISLIIRNVDYRWKELGLSLRGRYRIRSEA